MRENWLCPTIQLCSRPWSQYIDIFLSLTALSSTLRAFRSVFSTAKRAGSALDESDTMLLTIFLATTASACRRLLADAVSAVEAEASPRLLQERDMHFSPGDWGSNLSWKVRSARDRTIRTFQIRVRSKFSQNRGDFARIHQKSKNFRNVECSTISINI